MSKEAAEATRELCPDLSDREVAHRLAHGQEVPGWSTYREVLQALRRVYRLGGRHGITLFFTDLSGLGKSTLAKIMYGKIIEEESRAVTLLDGDTVRRHFSIELGFSKAHRDLNMRRIGFVASEITKNGGLPSVRPLLRMSLLATAIGNSSKPMASSSRYMWPRR